MKKILMACLLAAQIITSCAQESKDIKPYNDHRNEIASKMEQLETQYKTIIQEAQGNLTDEQKARINAIAAKGDSLTEAQIALALEVAEKFKDTKEPAKYIADIMYYVEPDQLKVLCDPSTGYYNEPEMEKPKKLWASYQLRMPGTQFKELTMQDLDGKEVKLSQWVGKGNYVLVDFWASWCGPCRAEMPNVVESYKRYHDKGYEIVGVSFDKQKEAWAAAVQKLGMTWPQISDLKGWDCAAHDVYGVNSIPCNILVDPQGVIVASDLRGEDLQNKLAEIYK